MDQFSNYCPHEFRPPSIARRSVRIVGCLASALLASQLVGCRGMGNRVFQTPGPPAPVVLQSTPTAEQIVSAVNQNTARVQSYIAYNARFSIPGTAMPAIQGNIALERPLNFRMQASTLVTGPEIDLGSNSDHFWFWVKRSPQKGLFFCRHDQFAASRARQMLPVDPNWIGDALGLVELNPSAHYEGPKVRHDGSLEIQSQISTPTGPMTRVIVVDPEHAWVKEQQLYDSNSAPVASAIAEDFRFDPVTNVSLPRRVTVRVPRAEMALAIEVLQLSVNVPTGDPTTLYSMPALDGVPRVDLGATLPVAPQGAGIATPAFQSNSSTTTPAAPFSPPQPPALQTLPVGGIPINSPTR